MSSINPFTAVSPLVAKSVIDEAPSAFTLGGKKVSIGGKKSRLAFEGLEGVKETYVAYRTFEGMAGIWTHIRVGVGLDLPVTLTLDGKVQKVAINVASLSKRLSFREKDIREWAKREELEALLLKSDPARLKIHHETNRELKGGFDGSLVEAALSKSKEENLQRAHLMAEGLNELANKNELHDDIHLGSFLFNSEKICVAPDKVTSSSVDWRGVWKERKETIFKGLETRVDQARKRAPLSDKMSIAFDNLVLGSSKKRLLKDEVKIRAQLDRLPQKDLRRNFSESVQRELADLHEELFGKPQVGWSCPEDHLASERAFLNDDQNAFAEIAKKREVYGMGLVFIEHFCGREARVRANSKGYFPIDLAGKGFSKEQAQMVQRAISFNYQERPTAKEFASVF